MYIRISLICRLVRRSLGDEIKRLGITGSPFCDKRKSLSPNRNVDLNGSLQDSSQDNQISDEITPTKKIHLETIKEDNVLGDQVEEEKLETNSDDSNVVPSKRVVIFIYRILSIVSIVKNQANHRVKIFFQCLSPLKTFEYKYILSSPCR